MTVNKKEEPPSRNMNYCSNDGNGAPITTSTSPSTIVENGVGSTKTTDDGSSSNGIASNPKDATPLVMRWYKLLFTKEDYMHHHKVLGILCVSSFIFRFMNFPNDMEFHPTSIYHSLTIPTMIIHALLTISSFQFKIPIRRIQDGGRIWPQYRYHSLIFTLRSVLIMALYYYEEYYHIEQPMYYMSFAITMLGMAAVEYVNHMVGPGQRSNTIREVKNHPYWKFVASTLQMNVTAIYILGVRRTSIPFYSLFTVQMTPFIGTLRRKGIFTSDFMGSFFYSGMLFGGLFIHTYNQYVVGGEQLNLFIRCIGCIAALFRFTDIIPKSLFFLQSKFFIWTVMYLVIQHYRSINFDIDVMYLRVLLGILIVLLMLTAYHKVQIGYYPKDVKHAKEMSIVDKQK